MKEKSHRVSRRCYRSGVEAFLCTVERRLDGYRVYNPGHVQVRPEKQARRGHLRPAARQLRWWGDPAHGDRHPVRLDQALGQAELGVDPHEQDRPTIGAGVRLVEGGHDGLAFRVELERDLGYTLCSHRASSRPCIETLRHRFYSTCERLGGSSLSSFVNYPG